MPPKNPPHPLEGKRAPAFTLESSAGSALRLSSLKDRIVVLYFYPKDNTSGCTVEAKEFRDTCNSFTQAGAAVLGVSPDSIVSHNKFITKYDLNFQLLSDPEHTAAKKYGVWVEKNMYGRKYMGIQRATFLIQKGGKVCRVWSKVKAKGHAREVLEVIESLAD
ncbi:MAG: thioredoxin-dependent thiol peroxidase [Candidatus Hydrogenedentes bacterium]|nr:thioredoxin-dependent thiol peroxidase [Candidatus Hydrogenedentota bacterium]